MSTSICNSTMQCGSQRRNPRRQTQPPPHVLQLNQLISQQRHLWSQHGADLGEQHVTRQSKQDVLSEGGKPHHPLKISRIL